MIGGQIISLPWPDSRLRPNARVHWSRKSKITKTARSAAFYIARAASVSAPADGPVTLSVTFYQPDNRHRDMDGCISQCKAYFDGLADAMRIDDRRFHLAFAWGDVVKPGRVDITIGAAK